MNQETQTAVLDEFRLSMSRLAAGVTIVASTHEGEMHGMAATSTTSVSIDPPTILVCLDKSSRTYRVVEASRRFCMSILTADQTEVVDIFAGRLEGIADEHRFDHLTWRMTARGTPLIENSLAWLDCEVEAIHPGGGSHGIVVGRVVEVSNDNPDAQPLVWFNRGGGTYVPL